METLFLACFAFGALFTAVSAVVGMAHTSVPGADVGHFGHFGHAPHVPHGALVPRLPHGPHTPNVPHAAQGPLVSLLPFLNASSLLAFLTWFGAAGYLGLRFAGWPLAGTLLAAGGAGIVGAVLVGLFMTKVLAGEQHLDPREFRLEGTLARVTVTIPASGTGEVVFAKAGRRRSEAARSVTEVAIARGAEVVILRYERGVAHVQPWDELLQERPRPLAGSAVDSMDRTAERTQ